MRYKEFKEKVEAWGQKYNYETEVKVESTDIFILVDYIIQHGAIAQIHKSKRFVMDLNWQLHKFLPDDAKEDLFKIVTEFAATKPEDREDEKRFIIPLPGLVTIDGEQQYLTKNGSFFASRRDNGLRQTWKEEHLKFVPEIYRQFAVEFDEDKEY